MPMAINKIPNPISSPMIRIIPAKSRRIEDKYPSQVLFIELMFEKI